MEAKTWNRKHVEQALELGKPVSTIFVVVWKELTQRL